MPTEPDAVTGSTRVLSASLVVSAAQSLVVAHNVWAAVVAARVPAPVCSWPGSLSKS